MKCGVTSGLLVLAIAAALLAIGITFRYLHEQSVVDDCLSGKHGSFDYATMSCDLNENHTYVPYRVRHPHDAQLTLVGLAIFALSLPGSYVMRRERIGSALKWLTRSR
jgi:hypothetical protein